MGKFVSALFAIAFVWISGQIIYDLAAGEYAELIVPFNRGFACCCLLYWAWIYHMVEDSPARFIFGCIKVAAALWGDWFFLGKLAQSTRPVLDPLTKDILLAHNPAPSLTTFALIGGLLAVLASGLKDIHEGIDKFKAKYGAHFGWFDREG